uniref:Uncharacterized protein n=1 Tax=Odontella aurita TaxID=265563 RepID=A0A7S4I7N5_9STRA|mmetsp:Transcript_21106/g.61363  ORF Transcript_21106/g.61363 Transcript_21106/m.61363 type:complete len:257 (+) Transcript_21106:165-935(+)
MKLHRLKSNHKTRPGGQLFATMARLPIALSLVLALAAPAALADSTLRGSYERAILELKETKKNGRVLKGASVVEVGSVPKEKKAKKGQTSTGDGESVGSTEDIEERVHENNLYGKVATEATKKNKDNKKDNQKNAKATGDPEALGLEVRAGTCGTESSDGSPQRPSVVKGTPYLQVGQGIWAYPEESCCQFSNDCESCCCYPQGQYHPNSDPTSSRRYIAYRGYCVNSEDTNKYAQGTCVGMQNKEIPVGGNLGNI